MANFCWKTLISQTVNPKKKESCLRVFSKENSQNHDSHSFWGGELKPILHIRHKSFCKKLKHKGSVLFFWANVAIINKMFSQIYVYTRYESNFFVKKSFNILTTCSEPELFPSILRNIFCFFPLLPKNSQISRLEHIYAKNSKCL